MKTAINFKIIPTAILALGMMIIIDSNASGSDNIKKKNKSDEFQEVLKGRGFQHISQFNVSKSDAKQTKYFVNFVDEGVVYDAYFSKDGELIEIYNMGEIK